MSLSLQSFDMPKGSMGYAKTKKEKKSMPKGMREKNACQRAWEKKSHAKKHEEKKEEKRKIAHTFK